jgi:Carboxypeptidase regulatory-like domain
VRRPLGTSLSRSPRIGAASVLAGIVGLLAAAPPALGDEQGRVAGRVLGGPEGAALADARVELHRFDPGTGNWQQFSTTRTDADGRYRFPELAAGRYKLCADSAAGIGPTNPVALYLPRCWRAAPTLDSADEIALDPGSVVGGVMIRLAARGRIRGHVTDPAGAPVTNGYAQAYWNESGRWTPGPWATFDDDGGYELRVAGDRAVYHVCFHPWDGDQLALQCWNEAPSLPSSTGIRGARPNRTIGGIDARLDPGARIEGLIRGYPVGTQGEVEVLAYRKDGGEWWPAGWNVVAPWTSATPFEIASLPAGTYRVCFSSQDFEFVPVFATECVGGSPTPDTGTDIEVLAGETTAGADVELGQASTIRGRVAGIDAPVPVQLLTASGQPIFERLTAADGTYAFSGLPNGSYKLAFNRVPGETRLAARFYQNKPEHAGVGSASAVELGNGALASGVSSTLVSGGSITGRVVDRTGAGIPGCEVRGHTPDGALVTRWSETDAGGWFDVGGLTTGSYRLVVSGDTCGIGRADLHYDADAPSRLTEDASFADPLGVVLGAPTAVDGDLVITQLRNLAPPSIAGTARAGEPLSADPGTWAPADVTFSYRWYADGVELPGATGPAYTPGMDQVGSRIRVRVIASKAGYANAGRTSDPTAPVVSGL